MPSEKTAEQLVYRTREYLGEWGKEKLRDGFSTDTESRRLVSILGFINSALNEITGTGAIKCDFYVRAVQDQGTYGIDNRAHQIDWVKFQGRLLSQVQEQWVYLNFATAYTDDDTSSTPLYWWSNSDVLGIYPRPDTSDSGTSPSASSSIHYFAETVLADHVNKTDVPTRLPIAAHEKLAVYAAYQIAGALAREDPNTWQVRQASLYTDWRQASMDLMEIVQTRTPYEKDHIMVGGRRGLGRFRHRRR